MDDNIRHPDEVLLVTVPDGMSAEITRSKLDASGIPCHLRPLGLGAYLSVLMGETRLGVEIFVPQELFDEACDVIADTGSSISLDDEPCCDEPDNERELDRSLSSADRYREIFTKALMAVGVIFLVLMLLFR